MAQFVHITDAKRKSSIQRSGIKKDRDAKGVFCMPVLKDHLVTHQWMRDLRRFRKVPKIAVQFRVPDKETVYVGRYDDEKTSVSATKASEIVSRHKAPFGLEVVIPRKIFPKEIMKFYTPPKIVGWRYWPEAKGHKPCPCYICQRGLPYSRKINERYNDDN